MMSSIHQNYDVIGILFQGAVTYRLPTNALSWSSVFRQLETNKERLGIVDYSVSQTTLEQVWNTRWWYGILGGGAVYIL